MTRALAALLAAASVTLLLQPRAPMRRLTRLSLPDRPGRIGHARRPGRIPAEVWAAGVVVLFLVPPLGVVGLVPATAIAVGPRWWRDRRQARLAEERRRGLVALWRAVAAELRTGRPAAAGWAAAVDDAPAVLRPLVIPAAHAASLGLPVGPRLAMVDEPGAESVRWAGAVLAAGTERGGRQAEALDRIADAAAADLERRSRERVLLAGGRATTRVLLGMPLLGLLLGSAVGAQPLQFLLGSPAGRSCLAAAGALNLLGWWWARRLTVAA